MKIGIVTLFFMCLYLCVMGFIAIKVEQYALLIVFINMNFGVIAFIARFDY